MERISRVRKKNNYFPPVCNHTHTHTNHTTPTKKIYCRKILNGEPCESKNFPSWKVCPKIIADSRKKIAVPSKYWSIKHATIIDRLVSSLCFETESVDIFSRTFKQLIYWLKYAVSDAHDAIIANKVKKGNTEANTTSPSALTTNPTMNNSECEHYIGLTITAIAGMIVCLYN
jgi:hypothetical protein